MASIKVWACLLAGLIAEITAPGALAWDKYDRGSYNNKMALLGFFQRVFSNGLEVMFRPFAS